jgi:glucosamine--fructose-6-phosphate aminotransferase (isomerizing)
MAPSFSAEISTALRESLVLARLIPRLGEALSAVAAEERVRRAPRLLLTGSGDSLFAARSALAALRRWSGLPIAVLSSIELARYESPLLGPADVVIGLSNSGNSTRTREAMIMARARGAFTIGISGRSDGPLAALAERLVHRPVAAPGGIDARRARVFLNMAEYLASLVTLYALGLALGIARGTLSAAEQAVWLQRIAQAVEAVAPASAAIEPEIVRLADELRAADTVWVLGAGPSYGTAEYSAAKFHEQLPLNGVAQDLEEWAHLQYFLTLAWRRRSVAIVLAPAGNALDRAEEIVEGISRAGGRAIVAHASGCGAFASAWAQLALPPTEELLTPILYHLPAQLLVLHLARLAGIAELPLRRRDDYRLIRGGIVRTSTAGLT